jgi:hypothetical protein
MTKTKQSNPTLIGEIPLTKFGLRNRKEESEGKTVFSQV